MIITTPKFKLRKYEESTDISTFCEATRKPLKHLIQITITKKTLTANVGSYRDSITPFKNKSHPTAR